MRGWRSKLIFTLIVYVAGFATAIHMLAPPPEGQTDWHSDNNSSKSQFDSEEFVKDFNSGMHKCLEFGKEAALRTAKILREKYKEMRDA
ncbi:MAG: hypothetical protein ACYSWO_24405 [Planctomycetota bacterium]